MHEGRPDVPLANVTVFSVLGELWLQCRECSRRNDLLYTTLSLNTAGVVTLHCRFCGEKLTLGIAKATNAENRSLKKAVLSLINEYRFVLIPRLKAEKAVIAP